MVEFYGKRTGHKLEKGGCYGTLGPFPARKSIAMEPLKAVTGNYSEEDGFLWL